MYQDCAGTFVLDKRDADLQPSIDTLGMTVHVTNTIMGDLGDQRALAESVLGCCGKTQ
jgi:hypothetical protein